METAVVSLICIALIVFGGMTMAQGFLTSADTSVTGLGQTTQRNEEMLRTDLSVVSASSNKEGDLRVTLNNSGQTKLANFSNWDVIVQYHADDGYYVAWLPYTEGMPGENQWTVSGIYLDGGPEAFEPGIFNPSETLVIDGRLSPPASDNTSLMAVVSTPNGVTASISFGRS